MKLSYVHIKNYKSVLDMEITDIENALILVGKNNTGKTAVIDAILLASGKKTIHPQDFLQPEKSIEITLTWQYTSEDLRHYHARGAVSHYKDYDNWYEQFRERIPSYEETPQEDPEQPQDPFGFVTYTCHINPQCQVRYQDHVQKHNPYLEEIFPMIYHIDQTRNLEALQNDVFRFYDRDAFQDLKDNVCTFDSSRPCNRCFDCIGLIAKKSPEELTVFETVRLLQYKLFHTNVTKFAEKVNTYFHQNGSPGQDIRYVLDFNTNELLHIDTQVVNTARNGIVGSLSLLSEGIRSIYALSLLEAYTDEEATLPCVIMMEDPEIYLHPQLQKVASEILYRLSKKNQVIFSTHSPNLIFNFSTKQIREVVLDEEYYTVLSETTDVDAILGDLGYNANDLMNVSFVFIVEGKQDSNRLPLLLEKYYSEIYDEDGNLQRISIIPVNSCTNIKTYANLKYINKLYLKDQFLIIRDSDGKNPKHLKRQLCGYYRQRALEDKGNLPQVQEKNVLILKYYSFENYFLEPEIMTKIGVVKSVEDFYNILFKKYKDYLYKLNSVKRMQRINNIRIQNKQDIKNNMELFRIYVRGHNLFDIFYGRYRGDAQQEILKKYIDVAPRSTFQDIFDSIDSFVYFENRRKHS